MLAAFATIAGLDSMSSVSSLGITSITLQFSLSRSIDAAAQDVQAALAPGIPGHARHLDRRTGPVDEDVREVRAYCARDSRVSDIDSRTAKRITPLVSDCLKALRRGERPA